MGVFEPGQVEKKSEETKVIRVPESKILDIKEYLESLKKENEISDIRQFDPSLKIEIPLVNRTRSGWLPLARLRIILIKNSI